MRMHHMTMARVEDLKGTSMSIYACTVCIYNYDESVYHHADIRDTILDMKDKL